MNSSRSDRSTPSGHRLEPAEILPGVLRWSAYSPAHKVELATHAVLYAPIPLLFDPFAGPDQLALPDSAHPRIVLTNENHERCARAWRSDSGLDVWASPAAALLLPDVHRWTGIQDDWQGWTRIPLPGAPAGETAFLLRSQSLAVFGDAVIHLPGRGLEILPDKYCLDPILLRRSLSLLPEFENAVFAHGDPLLGAASSRIVALTAPS